MLYILILPLIVIGLISIPALISIKMRKKGKTVKQALIGNVCTFFGIMIICAALPIGISVHAEETAPAAQTEAAAKASADGMKYLAAAIAVGIGSIGGGIAVAAGAPAAIGAVSEDPKSFSKALIFVALGEGCALYGFVVALLMLFV